MAKVAAQWCAIPFADQKVRVDVRTRTVDIEAQETVTSDSVTIRVNAVLYYRITDPEKAINRVREKRARLIKAEAEQEASMKPTQAAREIAANPAALELRRIQMVSEVGIEQNTTTIILLPSDFMSLASALTEKFSRKADDG